MENEVAGLRVIRGHKGSAFLSADERFGQGCIGSGRLFQFLDSGQVRRVCRVRQRGLTLM